MSTTKLFLFTLLAFLAIACSTSNRDPAQTNCNPDGSTNAGTHFQDYERCNDL